MSGTTYNRHLGIEILKREAGEAEVRLEIGPQHRNSRGIVHGGLLATLLDNALGAAVVSAIPRDWTLATVSLSVQYLDAASSGILLASGRVVRRGRTMAFAEGDVRDAAGRRVATGHGAWRVLPLAEAVEAAAPGTFVTIRGTGERVRVGKILAVGRNYAEHVAEMGNAPSAPPVLFLKPSTAIVHDGGEVRVPSGAGEVHHEVELVAVIGRAGTAIAEADALGHVLGYAVGLDMTLRDLQAEAKAKGEPWALSKGFDGAAPISEVVPREEVGDASGLTLALDVNGARRQEASTSNMIHGVASLVSLASRLMTLERGDLIYTGTPSGVGPVRPGDVLEARLDGIASLRVRVV